MVVDCGLNLTEDKDHLRADVNTVINIYVPQNAENVLTSGVSFSGRTLFH